MQFHLFEPPPPAPGDERYRMRWYQEEAVQAYFDGPDRQMAVMATGTGKSVFVSEVARRSEGRVLCLAHRDELVHQMAGHMERATGEIVGIEQRDDYARGERIVVASTQSITQDRRLSRFAPDEFGLVIVDEFHRYLAPTFRRVVEHFTGRLLGITATPDRTDAKSMAQLVDAVTYRYDILDGIKDGYLVPLIGRSVFLDEVKLDKVKKTAGDLSEGELDDIMVQAVEGMVKKLLDMYSDRKGIAFLPGVKSAELFCFTWNRECPGECAFVSGKTPKEERRRIIADFKRGRYSMLANCQVATEGFDCPDVNLIIHGRPTISRSLYAQMSGRGTRVLPDVVDGIPGKHQGAERRAAILASRKPNCVLVDFVGNAGRHNLCGIEDLLGGDFTPVEIARAKKAKGERDEEYDGLAALRKARERLLKEVAGQKVAALKARVVEFDPFRLLDTEASHRYQMHRGTAKPSPSQLRTLKRAGIPEKSLQKLTRRQANELITDIIRRQRGGLASIATIKELQMAGYAGPTDISSTAAQSGLDYIDYCRRRRRPIDPVALGRAVR